jgi:hypothetical protein
MQFRPKGTFKHLADEVSTKRAEADRDPNQKVVAELYKLLGNSYYGKCLTNKEKQTNIHYMGEEEAARAVNDPMFKSLDEIADGECPCYMNEMRYWTKLWRSKINLRAL